MFTTLNKVLLGLVLIVIVAYFLQNRANTPEACANIDGLWDAQEAVCKTPTQQVIFQSLSKPHPVAIVYPDSERLVSLDKVEQIEDYVYFRGHYETLVKAASDGNEAVYDRGSVYLNISKLTLLDKHTKDLTYFAAPFIINTAGNSVFVYVGLFSYDFTSQQAKHLSSALLGNRIREEEIELKESSVVKNNVFVQEGSIQVNFKSLGPDQTAAQYPTQQNEMTLQLVALDPKDDKNATFRRITAVHESWDLDHDGVNDCEQQGNCDHTVDYSKAKAEY